jgi:hypothetical protein
MREQTSRDLLVDQFSPESLDLLIVDEGASRRIGFVSVLIRGERRDFSADPAYAKIPH